MMFVQNKTQNYYSTIWKNYIMPLVKLRVFLVSAILISLYPFNANARQTKQVGEWKSYEVKYTLKGTVKTNTIRIPIYDKGLKTIRGVMQGHGGPLTEFAYNNRVALFSNLDGRGFSKELLKEAAKVTGHPELQYAGAIVQGVSSQGRTAAVWASENRERTIAVILDHSFCHGIGTPVMVKGVPMYFNATYQDMYQNHDRRKRQSDWCKAAYKKGQACTAVVDFVKNGGHGGRGTTTLTAIWLDEVMKHRVPVNVPDNAPYELIDVDPSRVGGSVKMSLSLDGKRTYHDKVEVLADSKGEWWMPGPRTAALYLEWVRKNGGSVERDDSGNITVQPKFNNPSAAVKRILSLINDGQYNSADKFLDQNIVKSTEIKAFLEEMNDLEIRREIKVMERSKADNDIFSLYNELREKQKNLAGIQVFESFLKECESVLSAANAKKNYLAGKEFYRIIERLNASTRLNVLNLGVLLNFQKKYNGTVYAEAAANAHKLLSSDLSLRHTAQFYIREK